jgi:copper chaperone CopZ
MTRESDMKAIEIQGILCSYCGAEVEKVPSTCPGCSASLTLSFVDNDVDLRELIQAVQSNGYHLDITISEEETRR